ncbi:hypothetical protein MCELHM10_03674 [Paracoccaceae bacterium]
MVRAVHCRLWHGRKGFREAPTSAVPRGGPSSAGRGFAGLYIVGDIGLETATLAAAAEVAVQLHLDMAQLHPHPLRRGRCGGSSQSPKPTPCSMVTTAKSDRSRPAPNQSSPQDLSWSHTTSNKAVQYWQVTAVVCPRNQTFLEPYQALEPPSREAFSYLAPTHCCVRCRVRGAGCGVDDGSFQPYPRPSRKSPLPRPHRPPPPGLSRTSPRVTTLCSPQAAGSASQRTHSRTKRPTKNYKN